MWHSHPQQQQRGGNLPRETIKGREAQDHEQAAEQVAGEAAVRQPVYPAGRLEDEHGDNTPSAPHPQVDWDTQVQPQRIPPRGGKVAHTDPDDLPLPEGK